MTGYIGSVETVYCNTATIDLATLPLSTWTRLKLVSAGNIFAAGSDVNFNIVSACGVNCLIDDITFGSLTEIPDEPDPVAANAIVPRFLEYVGSTFNGDFEVGNATVGNQYWGRYGPNQGAVAGSSTDRLPKFTAGAGLRRTFLTGRCRGLTLGGNVTHVGEVVQNYARADRRRLDYPAYTLVGLNASRTWKAGAGKITHTVSLSVANVLDEDLLEKSPASEQNAA